MARDFFCTAGGPVVQTAYGPVRGYALDGIFTFRGIRYAKARRFRMPESPDPWSTPDNCFSFKYECPVMSPQGFDTELFVPRFRTLPNEQCHYLNIWTPSLVSGSAKAVMVWLHGGAFSTGSGHAHLAMDGAALSRTGDVVVVTLNHRLNWLGFLDVSSLGGEYGNSVNAGMEDIVFALRWIRDNIAAFGGNPDNVTLFGQSGGGEKIQALLQIPEAKGLFRRGIIQSGAYGLHRSSPEERADELCRLLKILDIPANRPQLLEEAPYAAVTAAIASMITDPFELWMHFCPQKNSWYLGDIRQEGLSPSGRNVDILLGSLFAEFNGPRPFEPSGREDGWPEVRAKLLEKCGGDPFRADRLIRLFREAYPSKAPCALFWLDDMFRRPTLDLAGILAVESRAKVYTYLMDYTLPVDGGYPARHSTDIPFVFHNASLVPACNFGAASDRLEREISSAWAAFAKSGNPVCGLLPAWSPYTPESPAVMVFTNEKTECRPNPDAELAREWYALSHP